MYECPRNKPKHLSQAALTFRQKHQDACFWLRGMVPKEWTALAFKAEACKAEVTGIFAGEQAFDCSSLVIGTDASGGPHTKDPRLGTVGWAAVVCELRQGELLELGTISGVLPSPAIVLQGGHLAIIEALRHTFVGADITTHCKGGAKSFKIAKIS